MCSGREGFVCRRYLRHALCPSSDLKGINVRHVFHFLRQEGPHEDVVDDCLRAVFAELDRLVLNHRETRAREASDSVDNFVGRWV